MFVYLLIIFILLVLIDATVLRNIASVFTYKVRFFLLLAPMFASYIKFQRNYAIYAAIDRLMPSNPLMEVAYYCLMIFLFLALIKLCKAFFYDIIDYYVFNPYDKVCNKINNGRIKVVKAIKRKYNVISDKRTTSVLDTLIESLSKNILGISACVYSLTRTRDYKDVIAEGIKLLHFVKFYKDGPKEVIEEALGNSVIHLTEAEQHSFNSIESLFAEEQSLDVGNGIALAGTAMAMAGKEFKFATDFEPILHRTAFNIKNMNTVWTEIQGLAKKMGLISGHGYSFLLEVSQQLTNVREELSWLKNILLVNASEILSVQGKARVMKLKNDNNDILRKLQLVTDKEIKSGQLYTDCLSLHREILTYVDKATMVSKSSKFRVKPVGICIRGPEQIGKTEIVKWLLREVKTYVVEKCPEFEGVPWDVWSIPPRSDHDDGYSGQFVAYSDDGFQDKLNEDHLKYFSWISTSPVPTAQADLKDKGMLFQSKIVVVTCNELPTTSLTVKHVPALWARFPISLELQLKQGMSPPRGSTFDTSFSWLDIYQDSMKNWVSESSVTEQRKTNLRAVVKCIGDAVIKENNYFESMTKILAVSDSIGEQQIEANGIVDFTEVYEKENSLVNSSVNKLRSEILSIINREDPEEVNIDLADQLKLDLKECLNSLEANYEFKPISTTLLFSRVCNRLKLTNIYRQLYSHSLKHFADSEYSFGSWIDCHHIDNIEGNTMFEILHELSKLDYAGTAGLRVNQPSKIFMVEGQKVFWSPLLGHGNTLLKITPQLEEFIDKKGVIDKSLAFLLSSREADQLLNNFCLVDKVFSFNELDDVWFMRSFVDHEHVESKSGLNKKIKMIGTRSQVLSDIELPKSSVWESIVTLNENLAESGLNILFSILEFLRLPVNKHWQAIIIRKGKLMVGPVIGVIIGGLLLMLYKAFKSRVAEEQSIGEKHPKVKLNTKLLKLKVKVAEQQNDSNPDLELVTHWEMPDVFQLEDAFSEITVGQKHAVAVTSFKDYPFKSENEFKVLPGAVIYDFDSEVIIPDTKYKFEGRKVSVNRSKWNDEKGVEHISIDVHLKVCCDMKDLSLELARFRDYIFHATPHETYSFDATMYHHGDWVFLDLQHSALNAFESGAEREALTRRSFTLVRRNLKEKLEEGDFIKDQEDYLVALERREKVVAQAEEHSSNNFSQSLTSVHNSHACVIYLCDYDTLDQSSYLACSWGIGHCNYVIFNNHILVGTTLKNQLIKVRRVNALDTTYSLAKVVYSNASRDIAVAKFVSPSEAVKIIELATNQSVALTRVNKNSLYFPSIRPKLMNNNQVQIVASGITTLHFLPKSDIIVSGRTKSRVKSSFSIDYVNQRRDLVQCTVGGSSQLDNCLSQKGDCGGIVMIAEGSQSQKILGFHSIVLKGENKWCVTFLTKEDLDDLELPHQAVSQHVDFKVKDPWVNFIQKGKDVTEVPVGPCVKVIGKYHIETTAATKVELNHWYQSPWFGQFEEQLQPGPLSEWDERVDRNKLALNIKGEPSLLATSQQDLVSEIPKPDMKVLDFVVQELSTEYKLILNNKLRKVPDDIEEVIDMSLNGHPSNMYVKGIEVNSACGLPWSHLGSHKKSDFISVDEITGVRSFNKKGEEVKARLKEKLLVSQKQGLRMISFINSKLKDTCIKMDYVSIGKTRVFECVPIELILFEAALNGCWKEAYIAAGLDLYHAVGVNPHSVQWTQIADYINKHPNCFDADYRHYDKLLHQDFLDAAFKIKTNVINALVPDNWHRSREVLHDEKKNAYLVVKDAVIQPERGNKSGSFETTSDNCQINDIYGFYSWIQITGIWDLNEYRNNVSSVYLGDDKITSVSDKYADIYNFITYKACLNKLGHVITDGTKSYEEKKFSTFEELSFLKRTFKLENEEYQAPLLKRSIESPLVWTMLFPSQYLIWEELIKAQLIEAHLHGEEYYEEFRQKLMKCDDPELLRHLSKVLVTSYQGAVHKYWNAFYGITGRSVGAGHDSN